MIPWKEGKFGNKPAFTRLRQPSFQSTQSLTVLIWDLLQCVCSIKSNPLWEKITLFKASNFLSSFLYSMSQFSSVAQSCPTLCDPMDCHMPGFPVHHQISELAKTHVKFDHSLKLAILYCIKNWLKHISLTITIVHIQDLMKHLVISKDYKTQIPNFTVKYSCYQWKAIPLVNQFYVFV